MPTKLEIVQAMESAAFEGDWEKFKSLFTEDVYYKVGNTAEMRGIQAVANYLITMFSTRLAISNMHIKAAWETEDSLALELVMKGLRYRDNKQVTYPCVDIFHFQDNKIQDWRVYPIEPTYVA